MSTQIDHELEMEVRPKSTPELREVVREPAPVLPKTAPARRGPKPIVVIALGLVVALAVGFGGWQWWFARNHVSTDDAQVEGHIVPVLPKVSGYVAQVRIEENQPVHQGDVLVVLDDRDYKAKLEQTQADLAVAKASAGGSDETGQAQAQWAAAQAAVAEAKAQD